MLGEIQKGVYFLRKKKENRKLAISKKIKLYQITGVLSFKFTGRDKIYILRDYQQLTGPIEVNVQEPSPKES